MRNRCSADATVTLHPSKWRFIAKQLLSGLLIAFLLATPSFLGGAPALAANGTWNGGAGATWNTSSTNWLDLTGTPWNSTNGGTNTAIFNTANATLTVSGTVWANGLTFANTGTISDGTITLAGSAPTITTNAGISAEIGSTLAGSGGFTTTGGGTLRLSGSSLVSGTATFGGGEVILASGAALRSVTAMGVGTSAGSATLRVQSGAALTVTTAATAVVGSESRNFGTVIQDGGIVTLTAGALVLSSGSGTTAYSGSASYVLQGGTLAVNDTTAGFMQIARNAPASFTQSGGVVTLGRTNDALTIGDFSTGSYVISGGSLVAASSAANALLGYRGGDGTLTVSGSGSMGFGGSMFLAANANNASSGKGSATINLEGGTLAVNGMTLGRQGITGANGPGTATFNFSGGTLRPYSSTASIGSSTALNNFAVTLSGTGATLSGIDLGSSTARRLDIWATLQGGGNITVAGGTARFLAATAHTGATTVAGTNTTLIISSAGSIASSGTVTVGNAGSTGVVLDLTAKTSSYTFGSGQRVDGIGTISIGEGKTVSIAGVWAPGNSIGSNAVTGNLSLSGTSQFELGTSGTSTSAPGTSDFTAVSGTLTLGGALTLLDNANAGGLGSYGAGAYRLFTYGAVSGSYASITPVNAATRGGIVLGGSGTSSGQGVFLNVYNLASATSTQTVNVGNTRVGTALTGSATLTNSAPNNATYTETLSTGGFSNTTAGFTTSGSASGIAGGASGSGDLLVGLGAGLTAGAQTGTTTLALFSNAVNSSGLAQQSLASQTITITGTVWNTAAASIASGTSINFGTVLKGTSLSQALSITNTAPNTYSEKLDASFGSLTGGASTNGGSISLLAAGGTSAAMSIGLSSLTAGSKSGSVLVNFASNGDGTSGLSPLSLAPQTVNLVGTVLDPAVASFTSGSIPSTSLTLNFGSVNEGDSASQAFSLYNLLQTAGYTADLALTNIISSNPSGPFSTNLEAFNTLASGSSNSWQVFLNADGQGSFTNTWTLQFKSSNAGAVYTGDATQTLTLSANVIVVPEPGALALAGIGIAAVGWAAARRRRLPSRRP